VGWLDGLLLPGLSCLDGFLDSFLGFDGELIEVHDETFFLTNNAANGLPIRKTEIMAVVKAA